jgi:macrolide transport system ATP-binding/permease protein
MFQDLRYGVRMLVKRPGFTAVALLSLALGIGANTAIFSLVNTVLLRPLPIQEPGQLLALNNTAENRTFPAFSYPNYKDLRDRNEVFAGLIGYRFTPLSVSQASVNERLWGYAVTGNYFAVLGVRPALGRTISADDDRIPGAHPVTVVSYKYWQRRFGGAPEIIGKEIVVNGRNYTVIGVAPRGFFGTEVVSAPDLWFPMAMQAQLESGNNWLDRRGVENIFVQGRLKDGVSAAEAQTALDTLALQLEREHPDFNEGKRVVLSPAGLVGNAMRGPVLGFVGLLMNVVGMVLLLACVNLANLLLARAAERRREIAVRLALGASRFRLVRQLLTESLLLAIGGGALGLLPALWLVSLTKAIKLPPTVPVTPEIAVDHRVFIFTLLLSLATGVLFGLLPALQATRTDLVPALKDEAPFGGRRRSWWRNSLIVLQIALSLVLLAGGGLMVRALEEAQTIRLGFDPQRAIEVAFDLRLQGYDGARGKEFQRRLLERVRALPGVQSAGIADLPPIDLHFSRSPVFIEGQPAPRATNAPVAMHNRVGPGYFQAMGTRLLRGRDFTERDDEQAPRVAIVNETFARRFFPGQDPIGKRFSLGSPEAARTQIIGIVEDGKYASLSETPKPFAGRPLWQAELGSTSVIVRTAGDPPAMIAAVRREVQQLDPHLPVAANTLVEKMSLPLLPARIAASLLGGFGLLALALVAIGIYGVTSYTVTQRTHEFGVRMALGARRADIARLVLSEGTQLVAAGLVVGGLGAVVLTRLMDSLLYGVRPSDPVTLGAILLIVAAASIAAQIVPLIRATSTDPATALHAE